MHRRHKPHERATDIARQNGPGIVSGQHPQRFNGNFVCTIHHDCVKPMEFFAPA
jgi:hypothetical protein